MIKNLFLKKAISPVVATALLLVVAVVSVVGFQGWFDDFNSELLVDIEQDSGSSFNSVKVEGIINDVLYLNSKSNSELSLLSVVDSSGVEQCSFSSSSEVNNSGLFAHWKFYDNLGFISDLSGNYHNGNFYGTSKLVLNFDNTSNKLYNLASYNFNFSSNGLSYLNSNCAFGSCINLDGDDTTFQGVRINKSTDFDINKSFSVSLWFNKYGDNINPSSNKSFLFAAKNSAGPSTSLYVSVMNHDNKIRFTLKNVSSLDNDFETTSSVVDNVWNHLVFSYNGSKVQLYLNGVLEINSDFDLFYGTYDYLALGTNVFGTNVWSQKLNGSIDEVGIYSKFLSSSEVSRLYNLQKASLLEFSDSGVVFDGVDDRFEFPEINLDFNSGSSVYLKVKPELHPSGSYMTFFEHYSIHNYKYLYFHMSGDYVGFESNTNNDECRYYNYEELDNNNLNLVLNVQNYICNGFNNGIQLNNGSNPLVNDLSISGINIQPTTRGFKGLVEEIKIFNRILSLEEVELLTWDNIKSQNIGINKIDLSSCNLNKNEKYNVVGFSGNNKIEQSVIVK